MQPIVTSCPACRGTIRVRDPLFIGRPVQCPECSADIEIARDGTVTVIAADSRKVSESAEPTELSGQVAGEQTTSSVFVVNPSTRRMHTALSPTTIAWGIAALLAVSGLTLAWRTRRPHAVQSVPSNATEPDPSVPVAAATPQSDATMKAKPPVAQSKVNEPKPKEKLLEERLTALGNRLNESMESRQVVPSAIGSDRLPEQDRLGWLAGVFAASSAPPDPTASWKDPVNERFVRRRMDDVLNPFLPQLVGPDGYPATHFVGNAGVGRDARRLPADHSRAGPFGLVRATRVEDIRDGLSNTILVFGLNEPAGSWASQGDATLRELTREPYINGPDKLGTGQAESMLVLMADGSVRSVSRDMDPALLRSMAAMSDKEMEVPPDSSPSPPPTTAVAETANPAAPAIAQGTLPDAADLLPGAGAVAVPAEVPVKTRIEVEAALTRPVLRYEARGERGKLARELVAFAGVPFLKGSSPDKALVQGLKETAVLKSGPATVAELLEQLLRPAGLEARPEDGGVTIHPRSSTE